MELQTHSGDKVQVSDAAFGREFNEGLVHEVVTAYLAGGRAGTKAQKSRSDVSGGGSKPWRQKGTGRARAGTIRSPLWRTGGRTFAARPRDFSKKVNRKAYRAALQSILSELVRQERLLIVDELGVSAPRTKELLGKLQELGVGGSALLVTENVDESLYLSSRNLRNVEVADTHGLDPVRLIGFERVIMTRDALARVEEWLG